MLFWQNAKPFCSVVFPQIKSSYSRLLEMDVLSLADNVLAALAVVTKGCHGLLFLQIIVVDDCDYDVTAAAPHVLTTSDGLT